MDAMVLHRQREPLRAEDPLQGANGALSSVRSGDVWGAAVLAIAGA